MPQTRFHFTPPTITLLSWLVEPGPSVPQDIRDILLGELFASRKAIVAALLNGLVLNIVALCMHSGLVFWFFIILGIGLMLARLSILQQAIRASSKNKPTPTDLYLVTAAAWCGLEGAMTFTAMRTDLLPLQLLSATTVMGLIGPICARNYAAPRYALALIGLCILPFVAGGAASGDPWLFVLVLQCPLFLFGILTIVKRFQTMAVTSLRAEQDSLYQARHDVLTGLLNRFGLMEALDAQYGAYPREFILFYLDLDGFKSINDALGHHAGDKVLSDVARRLQSAVRPCDIVSRLGGDEFVIVARNMSPDAGTEYADRLIRKIADRSYEVDGIGGLRLGVSIGFACTPEDGSAGDDLHRKADAALYEAKAAGKGVYRRFTASTGTAQLTRV